MVKTLESPPEEDKNISNVLKSHPEQKNPIPIKVIKQNSQDNKQVEEHSKTEKTPTINRIQPVKIKQLELFTANEPEQLKLFEDPVKTSSSKLTTVETIGNKIKKTHSLVAYLKGQGFDVIDMREKGGALWVVHEEGLKPIMESLRKQGIQFTFSENGSRASKKRPAWFTKYSK